MTPEVTGLRGNLTVGMPLSVLRGAEASRENMRVLFAIDNGGRLTGVLELSDLVFAGPEKYVRDVITPDPISVETGTDQELCAQIMTRYDLLALPVIDRTGVLVGAISVEDLVEVARDEATEEMFRMVGIGGGERAGESIATSIRSRLPWLMLNLGTVLLAGFVLSLFDDTIERATILAVFIPIVLGQAGIAGTQNPGTNRASYRPRRRRATRYRLPVATRTRAVGNSGTRSPTCSWADRAGVAAGRVARADHRRSDGHQPHPGGSRRGACAAPECVPYGSTRRRHQQCL
jgi:hypothetical protein